MKLAQVTALARPLDRRYPTNLAIAALTLGAFIGCSIFRLISGYQLFPSIGWSMAVGLGVFLAWALARELDPDNSIAAFSASGLSVVATALLGLPSLFGLLWMLLLLRALNRTVGPEATIADSALIFSLTVWLTLAESSSYGIIATLGFLIDGKLRPANRRHLVFAGLALAVLAISIFLGRVGPLEGIPPSPASLSLLAVSVLFVPVIIASGRLRAKSDRTGEPLNPSRVQAAQLLALAAAVLLGLVEGKAGVTTFSALWSAMLGLSGYRLIKLLHGLIVGRG